MTRVPILMYHRIAVAPKATTVPAHYVSPNLFRKHVRLVQRLGYQAVPLTEIFSTSHKKPVVFTFDDGYENYVEHALPALKAAEMAATVFLVSNLIGKTNEWDNRNGDVTEALMSLPQILDAMKHRTEFGSHTLDHADLSAVDSNEALRQIAESKANLERVLGVEVSTFCYPYGRKSEATEKMVEAAGYRFACSTRRGLNTTATPRQSLKRINIRSDTVVPVFIYKLLREWRRA